jgi:hypothetical protein
VSEVNQDCEADVAQLLNACPYAGNHLADILADRSKTLNIRKQAAHYIGRVGYLAAVPALERLQTRLESRLSGQQAMPFAPPMGTDEVELLPFVRETLAVLRAP